jgi:hypothetical protein
VNEVELGVKTFSLLVCAGVLAGIASLWAFRGWSDTAKLRITANRIVAHLFELQLFAEEPAVLLRAQRDLLVANGQLLREVAGPSLLLVLPFSILLVALDAFCGRAPLPLGSPTVVTVQCSLSPGMRLPLAQLNAPAGMEVETPAVRVPSSSQISWRLRPVRAVHGQLQIRFNGRSICKSVSSSPGLQWLSDSRAGSITGFLLHPLELPFSGSAVHSISIRYPSATVFNLNWITWFFVTAATAALVSALALRRR